MPVLHRLAEQLPVLPDRLLIGLSGGADSVALLRLLCLLPGKQLWAVHVNHGLRGEASDGDEAFVRSLCSDLDVPLLCRRAVPPAHPSEDWARQARYGFFREAMQQTGAEALALAHHRDDQAETLLLHLLRGAGLTGLTGMQASTTVDGMCIVRPLLAFTRMQLQHALLEAGQPWREDASNADPRYLRNAIRTQLLPLMEQLAPGASGRIAATALSLQADEASLQADTDRLLAAHGGHAWYSLSALQCLTPGLQTRLLRAWWQQCCGSSFNEHALSHAQTDALVQLVSGRPSQQCNLPGRWRAYRGWTHLHLLPPEGSIDPPSPAAVTADGAQFGSYALTAGPLAHAAGDGTRTQAVPRSLLEGCTVRTWQPGDRIRPFGQSGSQSIQDYFTNRHVDAPFRRCVPLLCRGQDVLLCAGVGAGGIPPFDPTQENILLTWHGEMPWQALAKHPKGE